MWVVLVLTVTVTESTKIRFYYNMRDKLKDGMKYLCTSSEQSLDRNHGVEKKKRPLARPLTTRVLDRDTHPNE